MSAWSSATSMRGCIRRIVHGRHSLAQRRCPPSVRPEIRRIQNVSGRPKDSVRAAPQSRARVHSAQQLGRDGNEQQRSASANTRRSGATRQDAVGHGRGPGIAPGRHRRLRRQLERRPGRFRDRRQPANSAIRISELLVTIKVQDAFGAPVPGAEIRLLRSEGTGVSASAYFADQDGRAEILTDSLTHGALVSAPDMEGAVYESTRQADDRLEITVTLHPSSARAGGVGRVSVISSSPDGRELSFSARLYVVDGNVTQIPGDWEVNNVRVLPLRARCRQRCDDLRGRLRGRVRRASTPPTRDRPSTYARSIRTAEPHLWPSHCCSTRVPASRSPTRATDGCSLPSICRREWNPMTRSPSRPLHRTRRAQAQCRCCPLSR